MTNNFIYHFNEIQSHLQGCQVELNTHCNSIYSIANDDVLCQYNYEQNQTQKNNNEISHEIKVNKNQVYTINNLTKLQISKIAINPNDKKFIVIGTTNGQVLVLNTSDSQNFKLTFENRLYKSSSIGNQTIKQLKFTKNGKYLLIATKEKYLIVYSFQEKRFYKQKIEIKLKSRDQWKETQTQISSIIVDERDLYFAVINCHGEVGVYKIESQVVNNTENQKIELENQQKAPQQDSDYDDQDPFYNLNANNIKRQNKQIQETKISQTKIIRLCSYSICSYNLFRKHTYITGCFSLPSQKQQFLTCSLYLPGQSTLQKLNLSLPPSSFSCDYQIVTNIYHSSQILQVKVLKNQLGKNKTNLLLVCTQMQLSIRLESTGQKILTFDNYNIRVKNIQIIKLKNNWGFILTSQEFINKIYAFYNFNSLQKQILTLQSVQQKQNNLDNHNKNLDRIDSINVQNQNQISQSQQVIINKTFNSKQQIQKPINLHNLVPCYPQLNILSSYQEHNNARFLFYNNVGCIIQRRDLSKNQLSTIYLEFHDKQKISKIKAINDKRKHQFFALCQDTFVSASENYVKVQCDKFLKQDQNFVFQIQWEDIMAVTIGGQWICVMSKGEFKIFDWSAQEIFSIGFDRQFCMMASYEDHLAIVYAAGMPMWGVQSLKMQLYQVNLSSIKLLRDVMIPLKANSNLKYFNFTQEGMIICQDDYENLRVYDYQKDQWMLTISLDSTVQRLFIQHVEKYQIYGFKLDQRFPNQPRVLPRSLPMKLKFDLTNFKLEYLSVEQNEYIKRHKLQIMWVQHQKYRISQWFKYKYSRTKDHRWFSRSFSIKTQDQINATQGQLDLRLIQYLKKYIKLHQNQDNKQIWSNILQLCQSLAFYQETRNKLSQIIYNSQYIKLKPKRISNHDRIIIENSNQMYEPQNYQCISQLDRLQEMMGLKWVQVINDECQRMQIQ